MRAATRATREAIARRLATTPTIIEELENGAVAALPHWRETDRIIRSYCEILRLNPEPILWRIQQLLRGPVKDNGPTRQPGPPPPALRPSTRERVPRERSGALRKVMWLAALPVAVAALALLAIVAPAPVYRAIALLPDGLEGPARAGMDLFVLYSAPRRDGLRWIDVGDPRLRKGDKLRTRPQ